MSFSVMAGLEGQYLIEREWECYSKRGRKNERKGKSRKMREENSGGVVIV